MGGQEEFIKLELIKIGAEAVIHKVLWRGLLLIAKQRVPKPYRHPDLDREIRKKRTINEARVMHRAKMLGVSCPAVIHVELATSTLYIQFIEGRDLRDILTSEPSQALTMAERIGEMIGKMHSGGIYHGDVVPSNIMVSDSHPVLIDFGLSGFSSEIEEHAIDVHLLERSLKANHPGVVDEFMQRFMKGYESIVGHEYSGQVYQRVLEIRRRARYIERGLKHEA
ncbi:MAG: Kae1-associated kinase Bud32 [Nitrososphaerota archaeon]